MWRSVILLFCLVFLPKAEQYGCLLPTKQGLILGTCPYKGHRKSCPEPIGCGFVYPVKYSEMYECYIDYDCETDHKCCEHPCFSHKVCLKATY